MDDYSPTLDFKINPFKSEADRYFHTLSVRKEARSRKVAIAFLNQYLIPLSSTAETIDSVYISKDITVLFRITVSASDVNLKGITELTHELPFEGTKRICIVFVVLDHETTWKPYKRKTIVAPAGISKVIFDKAVEYHQYVYCTSTNQIWWKISSLVRRDLQLQLLCERTSSPRQTCLKDVIIWTLKCNTVGDYTKS